ncbi:hypothetical protein [Mucilaginibacter sp.]|jgi:hypothetical protein|uniref:hypothetical protein n=1 Tax=Mucilaginibacter sp. TaxID=1882438 RepID=UPI002C0B96D7|nr:hypothetical protein [Mucilaginibacter sp.]HTI60979.1 hypothetical protein [Mucilaginibacter sp.]
MSYKFGILMFVSMVLVSCKPLGDQTERPACASRPCTKEFRTISMKFLDKDGNQVTVDNYTATNMRTGILLHDNSILVPGVYPPYYNVADDNDLDKLSDDGDDVQISATNSVTREIKTAVVKVSGGCNCHVSRVSGPDSLKFN